MGVTGDWAADAPATIAGTHRQDFTAYVAKVGGIGVSVQPTDMSVTFSEDWSPRIQGSLSAPIGEYPDLVAALDPRAGTVCMPRAGYIVPGVASDVHFLATTHITSVTSPDNGGTMALTFASVEALAQDCVYFGPDIAYSFPGVREALAYMISYAQPGGPGITSSVIAVTHQPTLTASIKFEAGRSMWSMIDDLALVAGVRVQADGSGGWRITYKVSTAGSVVVDFTAGVENSIVEKITDGITRDGFFNAALIRYEWRDSAGADKTIYGGFPTGGAAAGWGLKAYYETRPGPVTQTQANAAAKAIVRALSARGDSYSLDAVAAYWLRDGDTVKVRLASGSTALHIVRAVTFHLSSGRMSVITRAPKNLGA